MDFFFVAFLFSISLAFSGADEKSDSLNNLDIDEILASEELLRNYVDCLLDKGPCTPAGSELKKAMSPDYKNDCIECAKKQREKAAKAIEHIKKHNPDYYEALKMKFDPDGAAEAEIQKHVYGNKHP